MTQLRQLVQRDELGGLVPQLLATVPTLTKLNESQARSLAQTRSLAACQNRVLLPFSKEPIPDPDFPANTNQPFYKQTTRAFVGLAGESRKVGLPLPVDGRPHPVVEDRIAVVD